MHGMKCIIFNAVIHTLSKRWPSDKLIMFVIVQNLHSKIGVINLVIDLNLYSVSYLGCSIIV